MPARRYSIFLTLAACLLSSQSDAVAQAAPLDGHHGWARFGLGSWKQVRVFTETLKPDGREIESVSITETKTTLDKADEQGYTLKVEVTIEVAGKRFKAEPQYRTYGYRGELAGQTVSVREVKRVDFEINGNKYPTIAQQIVVASETTKSVSDVLYSDEVAPYFLKRTTEVTDSETMASNYRSIVEVVALNMPAKVLTEVKPAAHIKTIETYATGTKKITLEVHCEHVPGGVVSHTSKELGSGGRVKRSTLELVDYEVKPMASKRLPKLRRRPLKKRIRTGD